MVGRYRQGFRKQPVAEYSDEFRTLSRADISEPVHMTVGRYRWGFRKQIRDLMPLSPISTMIVAYQATLNVEALLLHNSNSTPSNH